MNETSMGMSDLSICLHVSNPNLLNGCRRNFVLVIHINVKVWFVPLKEILFYTKFRSFCIVGISLSRRKNKLCLVGSMNVTITKLLINFHLFLLMLLKKRHRQTLNLRYLLKSSFTQKLEKFSVIYIYIKL
jgi:hypothetical protein